jgi:hypothetical protein
MAGTYFSIRSAKTSYFREVGQAWSPSASDAGVAEDVEGAAESALVGYDAAEAGDVRADHTSGTFRGARRSRGASLPRAGAR